ncbi:phage tail tip lysozyme [Blautia sp. MSJ-19]|uniref:phage tail tip lysozyme n=1 Tax=Blautia sp. MSJ-19 TaxID=2841517 RepID=UPI001C0EEAED|nr:phage tail tip lysozyme [Blautia sp. MSJ-19]MBU5480815.1 RICIN domain-containing protein [Blautia sp. MSJ-19]
MRKKIKKGLSCMMTAAMVMSTVNLPVDVFADDLIDEADIWEADENEDIPDVIMNEEEAPETFSDEDAGNAEDSTITVTDEIEDEFSDGSEEETEFVSSIHKIVGFADFDIEDHYIYVSKTNKPSLDEVIEKMPKTLEVYCEDEAEPVDLGVTWYCIEEDYETSDNYYFQFSPKWNEEEFVLDESIDLLTEAPYIGVFIKETGKSRSVTGNANETRVYNFLRNNMGLNTAAACGVLANIQCESAFIPNNLQNSYEKSLGYTDASYTSAVDSGSYTGFVNDSAGYGLCQWTSSGRKQRLLSYAKSTGRSIGDLTMQMEYLNTELQNYYKSTWNYINGVSNNADGAYNSGHYWCYYFERPANYGSVSVTRGNLARNRYWKEYGQVGSDSASSYVDVGTNFYAYLINTPTWLHATNDDSGNVSVRKLQDTSNQIWYFERQGDGSYKITSCKDGRCMEVHNFESANGTNVEMNNWNGNSAQRWFIYGSSGEYKFKAACGSNALDMYGGPEAAQEGTNLNMWEDNGTGAQKFQIWKLDDPNLGTTVASVEKYGDADGNNVKISWSACNNATGYDIRIFNESETEVLQIFWNVQGTSCLAKLESGTYHVKVYTLNSRFNTWKEGGAASFTCSNNLGSDFYGYLINTATWLHATNDGGNVNVRKLEGSPRQIWHFELQSDGSYKITSAEDDRCMEVHNFESANGTNVEMNSWSGNTAQRWFIYGSSGAYKLKAACGENALDMYGGPEAAQDGTNLNMWQDNGTGAQKFQVWKLDDIKDTIRNATINLGYIECFFNGKEQKPAVSVKKNSVNLTQNTDFKVSYSNNINVGTATVTITGIGKYTGTVTRQFKIKKSPVTASLTAAPSGSAASGTQVKLSAKATGGSGNYSYKFWISDKDNENWYLLRDYGKSNTYIWNTRVSGKKHLYVDIKDSTGTVKRAGMVFEVTNKTLTANLTASPSGSAVSGTQVKLNAKATGGSGSYTYKFIICDAKGNWYKIRDFGASSTCTWTPGATGKKTLYVDVKDSTGTVKRAEMPFTVQNKAIGATLTASPSGSAASGTQVKLSAKATGGSGSYTYKFIICDDKGNWYKIRDFGTSSTYTWKTGAKGKKTLYVDVKDSTGTVKRAALSFEVR